MKKQIAAIFFLGLVLSFLGFQLMQEGRGFNQNQSADETHINLKKKFKLYQKHSAKIEAQKSGIQQHHEYLGNAAQYLTQE